MKVLVSRIKKRMSLCFRTIPNKFTSFVTTRKQVTKIDGHLPKHVKSTFLGEFLDIKLVARNNNKNLNKKYTKSFTVCPLQQGVMLIPSGTSNKIIKTIVDKDVQSDEKKLQWQQYKTANIKGQRVVESNTTNLLYQKTLTETKIRASKVCLKDNDLQYYGTNYFLDNVRIFTMDKDVSDTVGKFNSHNKILMIEGLSTIKEVKPINPSSPKIDGKPSQEQLQKIFDTLSNDLPRLFQQTIDYTIYTKDIIFVNNIRGTTTKGIFNYFKQVTLLKTFGHLRFAYVKLEVLKITLHPEDDSIKARWRIRGVTGTKALFMFWKYKIWNMTDVLNTEEIWHDGFSTYYINEEGKVYKHVADKMMPDSDNIYEKEKNPIAAKLALFMGFSFPRSCNSNDLCLNSDENSALFYIK